MPTIVVPCIYSLLSLVGLKPRSHLFNSKCNWERQFESGRRAYIHAYKLSSIEEREERSQLKVVNPPLRRT